MHNFANAGVSVIIPTYNERENIPKLVERTTLALEGAGISLYELLFIDDHSEDGTYEELRNVALESGKIKVLLKDGKKGKAWSILQGVRHARHEVIAMIDADLQYPPEAIPEMISQLDSSEIVVANRVTHHTDKQRSTLSHLFNVCFGKFLFGMNVDMQSGLKVFYKKVFYKLNLNPTKWGFDYEFLFKAKRMKWRISSVDIDFAERTNGESKVNVAKTGLELVYGAVKLRLQYIARNVLSFLDYPHHSETRPINYKNTNDFLFVPEIYSAKKHIYHESITFFFALVVFLGLLFYATGALVGSTIIVVLSGSLAVFYFVFMLFKIWVIYNAIYHNPTINISDEDVKKLKDSDLPTYTIIIPLYREERVIKQIIDAMSSIDYPTDKLDIIITLEEYDEPTITAIKNACPPKHFKTLILPDVKPKTKPKALNVAFLKTQGEFLVIYDAEIIPDPDQLKKAVIAFRNNSDIACLQTKLDHYNPRQSFITRLFNSEFSFHYDYFLPGLQKLGFPLPLSGHSTHFRTAVLKEIGAWDPYNVTEDCEVGMRLVRAGYSAGMINSSSKEEATASSKSWVLQRTRWMKGFIQTSIVHLRHPFRFKTEIGGWVKFIGFFFIVPGTVLVNFLNFVSWIVFLSWLLFQPPVIQTLFPGPVLYISVTAFIVGNFLLTFMNLLSVYKRERYDLVKYNLLSFVYWTLLAFATVRAVIEFIIKPHYWEKTVHGSHLSSEHGRIWRNWKKIRTQLANALSYGN